MTMEMLRAFFGWAALINFALLTVLFLVFVLMHDAIYSLHRRRFDISAQAFDTTLYAGMAGYKLLVWLLFVAPWLALHLTG